MATNLAQSYQSDAARSIFWNALLVAVGAGIFALGLTLLVGKIQQSMEASRQPQRIRELDRQVAVLQTESSRLNYERHAVLRTPLNGPKALLSLSNRTDVEVRRMSRGTFLTDHVQKSGQVYLLTGSFWGSMTFLHELDEQYDFSLVSAIMQGAGAGDSLVSLQLTILDPK